MNNLSASECLVCGAPLEYLEQSQEMICAICHKTHISNVRCSNGHYICDSCHSIGVDQILNICLSEHSCNPIDILEKLMSLPSCHMHGPEHHIMVSASLLTAYRNAGGDIELSWALSEAINRGKQVPGGACGNWGACGAGISAGIFFSIATKSSPLAQRIWALGNEMTARALLRISQHGGPRCCKRDSYLAIITAIDFTKVTLGISMQQPDVIRCSRSALNNQCIGAECPFKH